MRIPTPLRSYTEQQAVVEGAGTTVDEVLRDLDVRHPGMRFRMVDEQNNVRKHMKIWVNENACHDLSTPVADADEITIMQALSGG